MSRGEVNDKSERYELSRVGATPTKNSGRGYHEKADGIIFLGEHPLFSTDVKEYKNGFKVTEEIWAKVTTDAMQNKAEPMLQLVLGDENPRTRVVVVSEAMFLEMLECYKEKYS